MERQPGLSRDELDSVIAKSNADAIGADDDPFGVEFLNQMEEDFKKRESAGSDVDSMIDAIDSDTRDLESMMVAMSDNGFITAEEIAEIREWDNVIARADEMAEANKSAILCVNKNMNEG